MNQIKITIFTPGNVPDSYTFGENYIKEIKFSKQLMDTSFDINPSIIEQYAEIVLKDKGGVISNLIVSGVLNKGLVLRVYIDDVFIQSYLTASWDIQAQDTTIKLYCDDLVKKLENKQTMPVEPNNFSLYQLFAKAFEWAGMSYVYESSSISDIAQQIILYDTYVPYTDLLTFIKKLCVTGFFRIYWDKTHFVIARCY